LLKIFSELVNFNYSSNTAIFTDSSHITTPNHSTSAAFAIPSKRVLPSWKLCPEIQAIEAELFATREALYWSQINLLHSENIVIFTDS
jgi:hypothetical protein